MSRYLLSGFLVLGGCQLLIPDISVCGDGIIDPRAEICDDANTADGDGCDAACQHETVELPIQEDFNDGITNFALTSNSETVRWHILEDGRFASPPNSLYFGNDFFTYADPAVSPEGPIGFAITPPFILPAGGVFLTFSLFKSTGGVQAPDIFFVSILSSNQRRVDLINAVGDFLTFEPVSLNPPNPNELSENDPVLGPLVAPFIGQKIQLAFIFEAKDEFGNGQEGVYIDDITITPIN